MPFRQYTQCYKHTVGDKPFNKSDLASFAVGVSTPGLVVAIIGLLTGNLPLAYITIAIQYAVTITAIANEWLNHRLVCISGDQCAVGTVDLMPTISPILGAFDNDQFFDLRLMPHRYLDLYRGPNCNYATLGEKPALISPPATLPEVFGWKMQVPPRAGPSLDGRTEAVPENDVFLDNFQGSLLLQPGSPVDFQRAGAVLTDLPYDPIDISEVTLKVPPLSTELPRVNLTCTESGPKPAGGTPLFTRATLHCEAEGNFWQALKESAGWQGVAVGVGAAAGAAVGAAVGCAIGGFFGPIGCAIGAIIGFLAGLLGGAAAGAYVAANAAFNSNPGDVNDANVGDSPLGALNDGDQVVVFGTHVYDGFHEGWHEFHPLKAVLRAPPPEIYTNVPGLNTEQITFVPPYIEWDPDWTEGANGKLTSGLTVADMRQGLASRPFRDVAESIKKTWCGLLGEAFNPAVQTRQGLTENRWTIHPLVDGCQPAEGTVGPLR